MDPTSKIESERQEFAELVCELGVGYLTISEWTAAMHSGPKAWRDLAKVVKARRAEPHSIDYDANTIQ